MILSLFTKFRSSVSAKIALIVVAPLVCVVFLLGYLSFVHERESLSRSSTARLMQLNEKLKEPVEAFLARHDSQGIAKLFANAALEVDVALIALFDNSGTVRESSEKKLLGENILDIGPGETAGGHLSVFLQGMSGRFTIYYDHPLEQYRLIAPIRYSEHSGALLIGIDVKPARVQMGKTVVANVLVASAAALALVIALYLPIHVLVARRIKAVSSAASKLASGELSARTDAGGIDEIGYLATSFNLLADEITNWRTNLEELAAERVKELSALYGVVETISQSLDLDTVLPKVLDRVLDNLGSGNGAIVLVAKDVKTLKLMGYRGLSEESLSQIISNGQGGTGDVILMNNPLKVAGDEDGDACIPGLEADAIRSALVVPIAVRGEVRGAIGVYSVKKSHFSDEDEALLMTIGSQVGVAVENARLYEQTLELARMDGLTGMANRRHLMERIKQEVDRSERYQTSLSLIILDLDKFKSFNDTYGHLKGDELLKAFSSMVQKTIRTSDIAGRYGGEEFCVILPSTSAKGAVVIAERVRKAAEGLTIPLGDGQPPAGRTVSIGVAEYSSGDSVEKLIAAADAALYRAKESGRNKVVV